MLNIDFFRLLLGHKKQTSNIKYQIHKHTRKKISSEKLRVREIKNQISNIKHQIKNAVI